MNDTIYRQAAIDALSQYPFEKVVNCVSIIEELPSAQPERKKGRWIDMDDHVMCSCCGAAHYGVDRNYCPNCGADMRGGQDETD